MEVERTRQQAVGAETFGGFVEEFAKNRPRTVWLTMGGGQHMAVANALFAGDEVWNLVTAKQVPEAIAQHAIPNLAEDGLWGGTEGSYGVDAGCVKTHFHVAPYAGEVAEAEWMEYGRQISVVDEKKPIGFAHFAGDFGEVFVGSSTDAYLDDRRNIVSDALFDAVCNGGDGFRITQVIRKPGPHFIDGKNGFDVYAAFHGFDDLVVKADIFGWLTRDDGDAGAEKARFADAGASLNSECLGFVGCGDAAGGFCHHWSHADGAPAQGGSEMLLDGCEV
jgi:hypothetical protein